MTKKRKNYSGAEKAKIALDAMRGELTLAQISSKYGVHSTQITHWKKLALAHLPHAFLDKTKTLEHDHEKELTLLYEQIGRLKVENEFLKKKHNLFA